MDNIEIAEELRRNPEADPTGFEGFMITEDYASVFAGLLGAYSNLIFKGKTTFGIQKSEVEKYEKRFKEIGIIKKHMQTTDLKTMRDLTELYTKELAEAEYLLLNKKEIEHRA